jgi:predicted nucleic acid-binding Zn ribbon protein
MVTKESKEFFNKPSTNKIRSLINSFKDPAVEKNKNTKFYNKNCLVCNAEFHPRHPNSKYCSHECQKILYLAKKKEGKFRLKLPGLGAYAFINIPLWRNFDNRKAGVSRNNLN